MPRKKFCFVPGCSTTENDGKIMIWVPDFGDPRRTQWLTAVGVEAAEAGKRRVYCCEDHFELREDAENWMRYSTFEDARLRLKPHVVPHIALHTPRKRRPSSQLTDSAKKRRNDNYTDAFKSLQKGPSCDTTSKEQPFIEHREPLPESEDNQLVLVSEAKSSRRKQLLQTRSDEDFGSSARIAGQTKNTSDDVTYIKEEPVDKALEKCYIMIKEELPANDIQDPVSISSDIKEETPEPTQTGSHVELPVQATDLTTIATDVKEEWIDDVTWKGIEKDDTTDSVGEVFAVKEENDILPREIGVFVEGQQAGPSEDVIIEFENLVGEAQIESGGVKSITLKKNKICDLRKSYSCYKCAYNSESKAKLRRHVFIHFEVKPYACDVCESRFLKAIDLKKHNQMVHNGEKPHACDVCGSKFVHSSHLKRHKRIHSQEKPYACDVCESRFAQSSHLKSHMLTHSGEKPHACDVCESRFARCGDLKRHKMTHSGEKPYACDACESRFAQSRNLKRHMLTHNGDQPHACDVCKSRFAQSSHLKSHMLTHSGEKPHACDVCESRFAWSGDLKRHKMTHSGEKPYACDACESRFAQSHNLKRHMLTHNEDQRHACDVCESRFTCSGDLKRHKKTHNGGKPDA